MYASGSDAPNVEARKLLHESRNDPCESTSPPNSRFRGRARSWQETSNFLIESVPRAVLVLRARRLLTSGRVRSHRHRSGNHGHASALQAPRAQCFGARLRGWKRCRRYLVLEPLPRSALRFGKLHLRIFVLGGAAAGVGLEGALLRPARDAALSELRRRQVRSPERH